MKTTYYLAYLLFSMLIIGLSCRPDDDDGDGPALKASTWKVGNDSFSTKNVYSGDTRVQTVITGDNNSGSKFVIYLPYIGPVPAGTYRVDNNSNAGRGIYFRFEVGTKQYTILPYGDPSVSVVEESGFQKYTLPDAWAKNLADSTDSVIVRGIFYEPQ